MAEPWILLTNDDGVDSPALVPFARSLGQLGPVRVVVPDRERSWVGKAITRYEPIRVKLVRVDDIEVWACTGYPADAVQIAISGLFDTPPAAVVSGINMGYNHGSAFIMSSGTIGAAVEAWVSGVTSIALSTGSGAGDWNQWRAFVQSPQARSDWERLSGVAADVIGTVLDADLHGVADVVSINLPFDADMSLQRAVTSIARVGYDRLFARSGDGVFVHDFGGGLIEFDAFEGSDLDAARRGVISITPINLPVAADVPDEMRKRLER